MIFLSDNDPIIHFAYIFVLSLIIAVFYVEYSKVKKQPKSFYKNRKPLNFSKEKNTIIKEENNFNNTNKKSSCALSSIVQKFVSDYSKEIKTPYIIGIAGPSGSGKSFMSDLILETLTTMYPDSSKDIVIISQDSYYKGGDSNTNYDVPKAIDFKLLLQHLNELIEGNPIECPIYDFTTHSRKKDVNIVNPAKIIIVEGILIFTQKELKNLFNYKIFVHASIATQLLRRLKRDINERGRDIELAGKQYTRDVEPSNEKYVRPSSANADIIINNFNGCYVGPDTILRKIVSIYKRMRKSKLNNESIINQ
jgi:uridine kinase